MELQEIKRTLTWFEKQGDALVGECELNGISLLELQKLFQRPPEDMMVECYPVSFLHIEYLQKFVEHQINLDLYDYFVEAYGIYKY